MMTERVTSKVLGSACRSLSLGLRAAEYEYKRGNGGAVALDDGLDADPARNSHQTELARREAELLEELSAIRKERAAG